MRSHLPIHSTGVRQIIFANDARTSTPAGEQSERAGWAVLTQSVIFVDLGVNAIPPRGLNPQQGRSNIVKKQ